VRRKGDSPWLGVGWQGTIDAYDFYQSSASGCAGQATLFIDAHGHCGGFDAGESYFPLSRLALPLLQAYDLFSALEANRTIRAKVGPEEADTVTFYLMGPGEEATFGNYWTTLPAMPTPTRTAWYLHTDGALRATPPGSNSSATAPAKTAPMPDPAQPAAPVALADDPDVVAAGGVASPLSYRYDPANPVPNVGGHNLFGKCGQWDQRAEVESRADVLSFTSEPFTSATAIVGQVTATLYVGSSANDTDFTAQVPHTGEYIEKEKERQIAINTRKKDTDTGLAEPC
jgi:hypothetical protein